MPGTRRREERPPARRPRRARPSRTAGEELGGYFADHRRRRRLRGRADVHARAPDWRVQQPGVVQLRPLPRSTASRARAATSPSTSRPTTYVTEDAYARPRSPPASSRAVNDDLDSIFEPGPRTRRASSSTARAPAPTSPSCAARWRSSPAAALSSGLMSFLEVLDRGAGATKSGGTTRRAAKMVVLDIDHPEIDDFITLEGARGEEGRGPDRGGLPVRLQRRGLSHRLRPELQQLRPRDRRLHGGASRTTRSGRRPSAPPARSSRRYTARDLWRQIADAAWHCADPGIQYDDTINKWHTCTATDRINASNPCSEYMFLDDTACNLAVVNLTEVPRRRTRVVRRRGLPARLPRLLPRAGDPRSTSRATRPRIAERSHQFRTLGLGYATSARCSWSEGLPYDSDEGRAIAGGVTAIMTGEAYALSAEMAASKGAFPGYAPTASRCSRSCGSTATRRTLHRPRHAARGAPRRAARECWDRAVRARRAARLPQRAGDGARAHRHHRPADGLRHHRRRARFRAGEVQEARRRRLLQDRQPVGAERADEARLQRRRRSQAIVTYVRGHPTLDGAPHINRETLQANGPHRRRDRQGREALPGVFDLRAAFAPVVRRGRATSGSASTPGARKRASFTLLAHLGFTDEQIDEANDIVCGRQTVEGAPASRPSTTRCSTAPTAAARTGTLHRADGARAHDGGGAAVPLRRDQQDHQPAPRGHRRGRRARSTRVLAAGPQGHRPLPRRLQAVAAALRERRHDEGAPKDARRWRRRRAS